MSTTPMKTPLRGIDIETITSIKKAMEDATALLESLMIDGVGSPSARDEREVIDLVSPDDDKENCEPSVATPSVKVETSRTPDKLMTTRSPSNTKTSPLWSKVDGLARALRTMNGVLRDSKDSEVTVTEDTTTKALYEVRAKPYRTAVVHTNGNSENMPWYDWKIFSVPHVLKLYRQEESGETQLVLRLPTSGIVKLNLAIRGNIIDMEMHIPPSKNGRTEVGQVSFFACEKEGALERIVLRVKRENVETLYDKLVELGATPKRVSN